MIAPEPVAALPMYDFPDLETAHDSLWSALRGYLRDCGLTEAPQRLTRGVHHEVLWAHPNLLLAQACEYPLAMKFPVRVALVAVPRYRVAGCTGPRYRSAILVRADDRARRLADLRGRRCVINDTRSNSGMNLLRAAIAPLSHGTNFFESVSVSGSHLQSARDVAAGRADVCAIDCVTLAHLRRYDKALTESLRRVAWTAATPSLPFVTSAYAHTPTLERLRHALRALIDDPLLTAVRQELYLEGFDLEPKEGFAEVLRLEKWASLWGYPQLH